jgi:hypothetical protein
MQMLYNSDSYAVMQFDLIPAATPTDAGGEAGVQRIDFDPLTRGGYEIVDKFARREVFIEGAMAERFEQGVQALIEREPTEDDIDDFLADFTGFMTQPVVLH